ncbi:hypothetical protein ACFQZS_14725 [Mucilaginibacter calamicampi]|uniref:Peptidase MA superfamily protein n=2 Tax=Mucilaginibacter calamicampi TaxID=1302352 RepID=A0ABW2YY35_9SPHI
MKPLLSFISILLAANSYAQIYLNPGVDTSLTEVKQALRFYNKYVADFNGKAIPDMAKYWPQSELKLRKVPDQMIYAINDYPLYSMGCRLTILYIRPTANYVHIKTQFSVPDSQKNVMTMAITNYYVAFDKIHEPYFKNPMTEALAKWRTKTVRNIIYHYPPYHIFNAKRADTLVRNIAGLEKEWGLKPININYYLANNKDELYQVQGFDYTVMMGNKAAPSGKSDDKDNQVFCGGLGENYFHEVVHLYLNHLYPKSPLQEGLAVFYAGSMGHSVKWHLKRVTQYLNKHPEADLTDVDNFWYTDPFTNPSSAIQGMICSMVFKKEGVPGLKRLMQYNSYKDIFKKEFNIDKEQINAFLRKSIADESVK